MCGQREFERAISKALEKIAIRITIGAFQSRGNGFSCDELDAHFYSIDTRGVNRVESGPGRARADVLSSGLAGPGRAERFYNSLEIRAGFL